MSGADQFFGYFSAALAQLVGGVILVGIGLWSLAVESNMTLISATEPRRFFLPTYEALI